jgi:hypothetical protein
VSLDLFCPVMLAIVNELLCTGLPDFGSELECGTLLASKLFCNLSSSCSLSPTSVRPVVAAYFDNGAVVMRRSTVAVKAHVVAAAGTMMTMWMPRAKE